MPVEVCQVSYIPVSALLTPDQLEDLESNSLTWGDANLTLVSRDRFVEEFGNMETIEGGTILSDIPSGVYIDMEN